MPSLPYGYAENTARPSTQPHAFGGPMPEVDSGQPNDQVPLAHWNQGQPASPGVPVWNQNAFGGNVHASASAGDASQGQTSVVHPLVQVAGPSPWAMNPGAVSHLGVAQNLGAPSGGGGISLPFHLLKNVARILPKV